MATFQQTPQTHTSGGELGLVKGGPNGLEDLGYIYLQPPYFPMHLQQSRRHVFGAKAQAHWSTRGPKTNGRSLAEQKLLYLVLMVNSLRLSQAGEPWNSWGFRRKKRVQSFYFRVRNGWVRCFQSNFFSSIFERWRSLNQSFEMVVTFSPIPKREVGGFT